MIDRMKMAKQQSSIKHNAEVYNTNIIIVDKPRSTDVLCGRGKICFDHNGNDAFRILIAQHVDSYENAPSKKSKMDVIMQVVDTVISRGGRFLVRNKEKGGGVWMDGGMKQGKKKTGHALRDALRGRVKCISEMRANNNNIMEFAHEPKVSPPLYYKNVIIPEPARIPSFDNHPSFSSDEDISSDPPDDLEPAKLSMKLEPERQWRRNSEVDNEFKQELLDFFTSTDAKEEPTTADDAEIATNTTLSRKRKKDIVKLEPET